MFPLSEKTQTYFLQDLIKENIDKKWHEHQTLLGKQTQVNDATNRRLFCPFFSTVFDLHSQHSHPTWKVLRHLHPPLVPVVMLKTKESSVEVAVLRWAERSQEWRLRGSVTKARRNAWHKDTSAPSRLPDCWRINRLRCKLFLCYVKLRRGLRSFCSC